MKIEFVCDNTKYIEQAKFFLQKEVEYANFEFDTGAPICVHLGTKNDAKMVEFIANGYISIPEREQGYSIYAGKNPSGGMIVVVCGYDDIGVLYGAVDFCNHYLGRVMWKAGHNSIMKATFFKTVIEEDLNEWKYSSSPSILRRAIWTWGHTVYDYKNFIDNMARLKLNELVLWNDFVPLNAKEVVEYAHSMGIAVIWGYAWGWDVNCAENDITPEYLAKVQASVIEKYKRDYDGLGDGIYFQSFTELHVDEINGKCIASVVTDFVNDTAKKLLADYPNLELQFGLHATSVKDHIEHFKKLDERVRIVWEDCGAFPYDYDAFNIKDFDKTIDFTDKLLNLRENEKFGAVLKGQTNLDWMSFKHLTKSEDMGVSSSEFIENRAREKAKLWKIVQSYWLENGDYARKLIQRVSQNKFALIEMLVEDGCFEQNINISTALCSEFMWNADREFSEILGQVSAYPCVDRI